MTWFLNTADFVPAPLKAKPQPIGTRNKMAHPHCLELAISFNISEPNNLVVPCLVLRNKFKLWATAAFCSPSLSCCANQVACVLQGLSSLMCALLDISQYLKVRPRPGVPWFHSFDSKASRFFFRRYGVKAILALGKNSLNNSIHIYIY